MTGSYASLTSYVTGCNKVLHSDYKEGLDNRRSRSKSNEILCFGDDIHIKNARLCNANSDSINKELMMKEVTHNISSVTRYAIASQPQA